MHKTSRHIIRYIALQILLLVGGIANEAWAAKVTYHILTLPINPSTRYDYHMKSSVTGHRLEAVKIVVDNQSTVELPAHYKSPLATGFTYYESKDITSGGSAISLYDDDANCKGVLYKVKGIDTDDTAPTAVTEGTAITTNTAEYYVIYTYNESNTIAKLDGSVNYNIGVKGKGFLSLNRGRNNRPAVIPTAKVDPEMLASEDFSYVDNPGNSIGTYWQDNNNNKNTKSEVESQFFFGFKFEGKDPYHIVVRTSYERNYTYIEKNEGTNNFVYKWYKGSALMSAGAGNKVNAYLASDDHVQYTTPWVNGNPNPENPGTSPMTGYFHGNKNIWSTVALLNNTSNDGYVFMGTRTVDTNGATPTPSDNKYNYLTFNGYNNLNYLTITGADATKNHTVDGIYPLKKVTFKVATPFYAADPSDDHIVSAPTEWVSQYTVDNDPIELQYLPSSLGRKYCQYSGKFYSDAACTNEITHFSQATVHPTEGYQVYIGYNLTSDIPFKGITPAATYTDETWANATWYELTDEGSTQADGLKLKYDGTNFKNNGADNDYDKTTEFAFIGDPYELHVVLRSATSGASSYYVGATGTPPTTGTALTASTTASEGYLWELPNDATVGSFLLRKYKGTGNWYWDAGHPTPVAVSYTTKAHTYNVATANAQTVTFNVSNLGYTEGGYIKVTAGGTNADQVTVTSEKIYIQEGGTASFTAAIKGRGDGNKTFTLSIQKYDESDATDGAASVVTVNQNNGAIVENTVAYSTASSTRVKVLNLPKRDFTYNIVDKSGRIAVKATVSQTIYSPLSLASIPSIIVSPYLYGETVTFYRTFDNGSGDGTGTRRTHLSNAITELTVGNSASSTNIYVKYTTSALDAKPINLREDQELNVKLNGQYIYYDKTNDVLKTNANPTADDLRKSEYLWKLRNRDPYAMLIDNMGAREDLSVANQSESVTVYDESETGTLQTRQKGAWLSLASIVNEGEFTFTTTRANAQQFIAKSSLQQAVYEVMVADGGDASTTYYDIGCPEANTVKIYNNLTYAHGHDVLRFVLNQNIDYTYHLIDKDNHELLTASSKTPDLALPAEYQSPLVATYHFYDEDNISESEGVYTVKASPTELSSLSSLLATATEPATSNATDYGNADTNHKHADAVSTDDIKEKAKYLTITGNHYFKIGDNYYVVDVSKACYYDIYVTYDVNDVVNFNKGQYMLKFLQPYADGYYLEDGDDKLIPKDTEKPNDGRIQAVYPYCNGDGNLNIYGAAMQNEQFNGGASTRPRWVWYFDSEKSDPYHVRIRSRSTVSYKGISNPTCLTTYAVHFNQDTEHPQKQYIVTGGTLPGVASVEPMEYMVLGSAGNYKLLTTEPVAADLNGDGDKTDDGENERQYVTSFEQYWKTYNMLKLHVLGISKDTNEYSDDASTWVVPADKRTELETKLAEKGVGTGKWHSYDAYANATRWNGYNDKSDGEEKKVVEKLEHWYQTFEMGNGTFNIESADVPPVLVLLDRHGWEIMRRPLPGLDTYPEGEELAGLRVYDSPLVDKYYFYSNATKASGCHKYTMRLQDGKERDQIKVNGERYSSSSLGDLPPRTATGVVSGGAIQDFYVIYTVKEEYENNYDYNLDYSETKDGDKVTGYTINSETGTSQPYLVLQNGRFYKAENTLNSKPNPSYFSKPISEHTNPEGGNVYDLIVSPHNHGGTNNNIIDGSGNFIGNNFWLVKPNINIDEEMGIKWGTAISGAEPLSKVATQVTYKDKSGFDPYNIQLQLAKNNSGADDGRYLTTHITSAHLDNGIMVGDYSETGGTKMITLEDACTTPVTSEGYDHSTLQITNQTFMAVSDVNGNMQLMPRFDHTQRVDLEGVNPWETKLKDPVDHAKASVDNNSSMGPQTTFFVCPQRFHYHIIDNNGREALRYKRGADFYPAITDHFKSPLAKEFTFYTGLAESETPVTLADDTDWNTATGQFKKSLTKESMLADAVKLLPTAGTYYYRIGTRGVFTYKKVVVTKGLSEKEITGSFAAANLMGVDRDVYVRYNYDEDADHDADKILQGPWLTVKLAEKDLQASGTVVVPEGATQGTGVSLYAGNSPLAGGSDPDDKPATVNASAKKWQWKFLAAPTDPSSDYYVEPDPYAIQIFNREANYTDNPSVEPSPMGVGIKVPNANDGADRFALLSHPSGGYALVVAKTYDSNCNYLFLNGENMTIPSTTAATAYLGNPQKITVTNADAYDKSKAALSEDGEYYFKYGNGDEPVTYTYKKIIRISGENTETASTEEEWNSIDTNRFTYKENKLNAGTRLLVENDVQHTFTYNVITNGNKLAVTATQTNAEADSRDFAPYVPESAQTPLLNMDDYLYYGFATESSGTYTVIPQTKLYTLYGLYDDVVYVRYPESFNSDKTPYMVPNKKGSDGTHVIRHADSNDVPIDISGKLPYNIIWYNDNMMCSTDGSTVSDGRSKDLTGDSNYTWYFVGGDPYALNIKKAASQFVNASAGLSATPQDFMLLRKDGYDYGVFAKTGEPTYMLSFEGSPYSLSIAEADPNHFIPFALSTHRLVYHLVINTSNEHTIIPYRTGDEDDYTVESTLSATDTLMVRGTTQRDLTSQSNGIAGDRYQLGRTIMGQTYCKDAGQVSIGDELVVPNEFSRPNCVYFYYIDNIQTKAATPATYQKTAVNVSAMESDAASLSAGAYYYYKIGDGTKYYRIHKESSSTVIAECTLDDYDNCWQDDSGLNNRFKGLEVTKLMSASELVGSVVKVNVVYKMASLETNVGDNFITEMKQAGTHYLWYTFETAESTPQLAHYTNVAGMKAESGRALHYTNDYLWAPLGDPYGFKSYNRYIYKNGGLSTNVLTTDDIANNEEIKMGATASNAERDIYELLESANPGSGSFRVHPLLNTERTLFLGIDGSNKLILSNATPAKEWIYGLSEQLLNPYYQGAGNVGGLTTTAKSGQDKSGKVRYEEAQTTYADKPAQLIRALQQICYNKDNIVDYAPGYYRLCNQPGASSLSPQRYASGYLHDIEKTAGTSSTPIPMHFYSKKGVTGTFNGDTNPLRSGFTETAATRGDIPIPATEYDPSTIFRFTGTKAAATMQTQGLYVQGVHTDQHNGFAKMTATEGSATSFKVEDIGGAVVIIYNEVVEDEVTKRRYLNYNQGDEEHRDHIYDLQYFENVPVDGSKWCMESADTMVIATNNGGDGYYYATFYAPFDVKLPNDADGKTYNAYVCTKWYDTGVFPVAVPATSVNEVNFTEGKFVPGNTPVIIRVKDESGSLTLTLPTTSPSSAESCVFTGSHLEQLLAVDASHDVYTLGLYFTSDASIDRTTGVVTAPLPEFATSGVGFYINATPNKEHNALEAQWQRNNRYVLHNKIYYRAPSLARGIEFVPVIFDDDDEELQPDGDRQLVPQGDNRIYDLQGRCVATEQEVQDGTWHDRLAPGIYILNGRKFSKK